MQKGKKQLRNSIITIIAIILALIIVIILYINTSANPEIPTFVDLAKTYCNKENIESVSICNGQLIQVKSDLLGGGSTYHHKDGTTFTCPIIGPDSMSADCKAIFNAEQNGEWNCVEVC